MIDVWRYVTANWVSVLRLAGEHLQIVGTAMGFALLVAVPAGVVLTRAPGLDTVVLGIIGILQTIPSLALLAVMIPFLGIGFKPAVAALFLYALLPIARNVYVGVKEVVPELVEAAKGMGMTRFQVLTRVQIPIALPVIIGGVRTAAVICVGTATIAAAIGSGGLGSLIYRGLQQMRTEYIVTGALLSALLAILIDSTLGAIERWLTPSGILSRQRASK